MKLTEIGELGLLREIERSFAPNRTGRTGLKKGIGDDTSVATLDGSRDQLVTTDTLVEGVHFSRKYTPPRQLGRKALSVSLSDIAAMGARPLYALSSLVLPPSLEVSFVKELLKGLRETGDTYGLAMIGGNTASSPSKGGGVAVTTVVIGETLRGKAVLRSRARVGEAIYLTGTIGDSALGLRLLKRGRRLKGARGVQRGLLLSHLDPEPRLEAGHALAKAGIARAMIDVSDGLLMDMARVCEASKVGAELLIDSIPLSKGFLKYAPKGRGGLGLALSGGEDYELLFTARERDERKIARLSKKISLPIARIGRIVEGMGSVKVMDKNGREVRVSGSKGGYEHFL